MRLTLLSLKFNNHSILQPLLCEATYVILEYSKSSTYTWMFIEALHLHNAVAGTFSSLVKTRTLSCTVYWMIITSFFLVTATKMSFKKYYLFFGWGISVFFVVIWVTMMLLKPQSHCWWGYNYNPLYWILEGPRICILIVRVQFSITALHIDLENYCQTFLLQVNTVYLIKIIKVVFIKLRTDTSNEIQKLR